MLVFRKILRVYYMNDALQKQLITNLHRIAALKTSRILFDKVICCIGRELY